MNDHQAKREDKAEGLTHRRVLARVLAEDLRSVNGGLSAQFTPRLVPPAQLAGTPSLISTLVATYDPVLGGDVGHD